MQRRSLARSSEHGRIARFARLARLPHRRRSREAAPNGLPWLEALARQKRTRATCAPETRTSGSPPNALPQFRALFPDATLDPAIEAPQAQQAQTWTREDALVEILRGRLEGQGPVAESALALPLGLPASDVAAALTALQTEGFAMRGRFSDPAGAEEWCERRLLARIHHYTVKRLRAEIEPVSARDFMRFLFAWQRVAAARMEGTDALGVIICAARRLRSRGRRVGKRNPARAPEGLRIRLAR